MADIQKYLDQIRRAVYGREVRESIATSIELINKEQSHLDGTFDQLIINAGNSNAEIVDARVKADGTQFNTLGERLNKNDEDLLNLRNDLSANIDNINKEVIEARTDRDGVNHGRLKPRIDSIEDKLDTKADQTSLDETNASLDIMRENVFEINSKFTKVFNPFKDAVQTQDIKDMRCRIDVNNALCGVVFKFNDTKDLIFQIRKPTISPNKLPSPFGALLWNDNTGQYPIAWDGVNRGSLYAATTDWLGPMVVEAINNGDGSNTRYFTGGFHGDTGGLTGNPTARNVSFKILVDGVEKNTNVNDIQCKKVEFISVNRLYAYNTISLQREVVEEKHHMIMKAKKGKLFFEVFTEITALEDINIHVYYGLQTHSPQAPVNLWGESVHFVGGQQKNRVPINKDLDSGKRGDYLCTRIVQRSEATGYDLMSWIDSGYGLGTMTNCNINKPCVKVINSTKKSYFNLVIGDGTYTTPLTLKGGEKTFWHGGYTLSATKTSDDAVDCEISKLENDKLVKTIDFLKQANKQISLSSDYAGGIVNIVGGIGYNKLIYDNKLNITSPGYGSIEILE